mgnify:FL=1
MTFSSLDTIAQSLLDEFGDHSISLAISYMGDLIYSKGFGHINTGETLPTSSETQYRIASVSKPITSTAIHILIERGLLDYKDLVFGTDGILSLPGLTQESLQAVQNITVDQLLLHSSGLTRSTHHTTNVPIFEETNQFIEYVINTTPKLDSLPGSQYSYSNIGYNLLAEVITQVSGKAYPDFVADEILKPLGIKAIVPGDENQFAENEVTDYQILENKGHQAVGSKYYQMEPNLGSGGWVASPEALLKFISAIKGHSEIKILKKDTIEKMLSLEGPEPSSMMARGWLVNPYGSIWHDGTLRGQNSSLISWKNGISYAVIANRSGWQWNSSIQERIDSYKPELEEFASKAAHTLLYFATNPNALQTNVIANTNAPLHTNAPLPSQDNDDAIPESDPLAIESYGNIYLLQGDRKLAFARYRGTDDLISINDKRQAQYATKEGRWEMLAIDGSENNAEILWQHNPKNNISKLKVTSYSLKSNNQLGKFFVESSAKPLEVYELDSIGAQRLKEEYGLSDNSPKDSTKGIKGSSERDRLNGTRSHDELLGYESADRINGMGGDDIIDPGLSTEKTFDKVKGGSGSDTFIVKDGYHLLIRDFEPKQDILDFSGIQGGYNWEPGEKSTMIYDNDSDVLAKLTSPHNQDTVNIVT